MNDFYKLLVITVIFNEKQTNWKQTLYRKIMSKRHGIFTRNFTFFKMQEKPETCRSMNLKNSGRPSSGDDKCNICIAKTSALEFN